LDVRGALDASSLDVWCAFECALHSPCRIGFESCSSLGLWFPFHASSLDLWGASCPSSLDLWGASCPSSLDLWGASCPSSLDLWGASCPSLDVLFQETDSVRLKLEVPQRKIIPASRSVSTPKMPSLLPVTDRFCQNVFRIVMTGEKIKIVRVQCYCDN